MINLLLIKKIAVTAYKVVRVAATVEGVVAKNKKGTTEKPIVDSKKKK